MVIPSLENASPIWTVIIIGSIAFVVALVGVPTVRRLAVRTGVLDNPEQGKMHTGATPYFGGLAIGFATLLIPSLFQSWTREAAYIGVAAIMVSLCGLVDDLRNLNPYARLGVEILAAALAVHAGARMNLFGNWLDVALTILWIVVITNSFNLLDNMDGVAGTIATATAIALVVAAVLQDQVLVGALAAALAGGCLGFLVYNWHPATIFMGDAGSLLLGFLLAVVSLKLRWSTPHFESVTAVILIMAPAVFDTALVVVSRKRAGRSIMVGGTDHTSHRLHQLGLPIRWVATSLGLVAIACASLGVLVGRGVVPPLVAIIPLVALSVAILVPLLRMPVYATGAGRVRGDGGAGASAT
jgi:UDP-GlcNAc:undecaprenyl-phosphate GlcNAc-1-phosphate transferase